MLLLVGALGLTQLSGASVSVAKECVCVCVQGSVVSIGDNDLEYW